MQSGPQQKSFNPPLSQLSDPPAQSFLDFSYTSAHVRRQHKLMIGAANTKEDSDLKWMLHFYGGEINRIVIIARTKKFFCKETGNVRQSYKTYFTLYITSNQPFLLISTPNEKNLTQIGLGTCCRYLISLS
jgi:hypothetical protein